MGADKEGKGIATPKISVVMSAYNSELTIRDAITSILQQTYTDFEFLIVDDGSTDNTISLIQDYNDPRIKVLRNTTNIGLTRSLNKAISASSGEFIARQDADDVSLPERFQKQIEFLTKNPDVALVGTSRATLNDTGAVIAISKMPKEPTFHALLKSNHFAHGSIILRRQVFNDVGLYNEYFRLSQDYELWLRISQKYRVANIQEPLYGVRRHGNRVTLSRLSQALLFKLMAVHLAQGKVSQDTLKRVQSNGIESYYEELSKHDKVTFHQKAAKKYFKYKLYADAKHHLTILLKLNPYSITTLVRLAYLQVKNCETK